MDDGQNDQRARSNLVMRVPLVPYPLASGRAEAAPAVLTVGIAAASHPAGRADSRRLGFQDRREALMLPLENARQRCRFSWVQPSFPVRVCRR